MSKIKEAFLLSVLFCSLTVAPVQVLAERISVSAGILSYYFFKVLSDVTALDDANDTPYSFYRLVEPNSY
jgi:hypothetical protein